MKILAVLAALAGSFAGCTAAQLETVDPTCIVKDRTCPDAHGGQQPLVCGYECCSWHGMGAGSCPTGYACTNTEDCTATPLPDNDPSAGYGAPRLTRRSGL